MSIEERVAYLKFLCNEEMFCVDNYDYGDNMERIHKSAKCASGIAPFDRPLLKSVLRGLGENALSVLSVATNISQEAILFLAYGR